MLNHSKLFYSIYLPSKSCWCVKSIVRDHMANGWQQKKAETHITPKTNRIAHSGRANEAEGLN